LKLRLKSARKTEESFDKIEHAAFTTKNHVPVTLGVLSIFPHNRAFHRIGQAKFPDGGFALDSSQFSILPQLHQKMMLASKGVKIDPK